MAVPRWRCALPTRKRMSGPRVLQGVSGLMRTVNISSDPWGITHDRDWHDLTPWWLNTRAREWAVVRTWTRKFIGSNRVEWAIVKTNHYESFLIDNCTSSWVSCSNSLLETNNMGYTHFSWPVIIMFSVYLEYVYGWKLWYFMLLCTYIVQYCKRYKQFKLIISVKYLNAYVYTRYTK